LEYIGSAVGGKGEGRLAGHSRKGGKFRTKRAKSLYSGGGVRKGEDSSISGRKSGIRVKLSLGRGRFARKYEDSEPGGGNVRVKESAEQALAGRMSPTKRPVRLAPK